MGVMPVNRLLISMALPMVISMLVQALYNIVDSIFVARLSEDALTAVSMAFPMQNLMISVAVGLGVGINAFLSRSLGQKDFVLVNKTAVNGIFLEAVGYILFLIISFTAVRPFYVMQAGEGEITEMGIEYLTIATAASFGMFAQIGFERILQSTGRTLYTMITQTTGAVINIILDPILIFGLLGAPKMGIAGAAVATVTGQIIAGIMAIIINHRKNHEVKLNFRGFCPEGRIIKNILSVGVPSIIMASVGSVMTFGMNKILIGFTSTAVAVFGVYFKLQSFVFMPVFGLNNGMVPIVSYNYGAKKKDRMMKTIKLSMVYAVGIMLLGLIVIQLFPNVMLKMFDASDNMLAIGVPALRIISTSFMFAGVGIVMSSVFQALGHGMSSMLVSITRQIVVLLPAAYLLSLTGSVNMIWLSFPIAEVASLAATMLFFANVYKKTIKMI
ncbi:MAG: MATE family efflux transporter [Clostridia bacterium]|nr:MATE family efflux transporter [Clostridia bacterium]